MLILFSTITTAMPVYDFVCQLLIRSIQISMVPSVSIRISFVKSQAVLLSIGRDFPLLSLIVAEVTLSLVLILNVAFVPCFILVLGRIWILSNTQSLIGLYENLILSDSPMISFCALDIFIWSKFCPAMTPEMYALISPIVSVVPSETMLLLRKILYGEFGSCGALAITFTTLFFSVPSVAGLTILMLSVAAALFVLPTMIVFSPAIDSLMISDTLTAKVHCLLIINPLENNFTH